MNEQPNNETLIQSSSRDLQIIEDDAFSYEGYQVVRGEFFAHTYEPSFTFNANKVSVNTACIKKLPKTDFVQIRSNYFRQGRRNLDGYRMYYNPELLSDLFDAQSVFDPSIPVPVPTMG